MNAPTVAINRQRIVYDGPLGRLREHRHAVIALLVGLERDFSLWTGDGGERQVRFALVPADVRHRLDFFGARTLVVYVEPHDPVYGALHRGALGCCRDLTELPKELAGAVAVWTRELDPQPLVQAAARLYATQGKPLDDRVTRVAQLWNAGELLDAEVHELARVVALSPSRLLHLFKADLGVGIRRVKQHYRFKIAASAIGRGSTFTHAAYQAGFADSAHLSRAFAETFGLSPTAVLGVPVRWLTDADLDGETATAASEPRQARS